MKNDRRQRLSRVDGRHARLASGTKSGRQPVRLYTERRRYTAVPAQCSGDEDHRPIRGAMNDGPVYASIFNSLKGVSLQRPDPFAPFQSDLVVYHDDFWDYATNEPTLDGTAEALYWLAALSP